MKELPLLIKSISIIVIIENGLWNKSIGIPIESSVLWLHADVLDI